MAYRNEKHVHCKWPDALVAKARELNDSGLSRLKIADALGVPPSTVRDWLRYWTRVEDDDTSGPQRERNWSKR
jgi:orotate phosphoribosyltransferase-like protein